MNDPVTHLVVVTQLALKPHRNAVRFDKTWLERRLDRFEQTTMRSALPQVVSEGALWLVLYDSRHPGMTPESRARVRGFAQPGLEVLETPESWKMADRAVRRWLGWRGFNGPLITVRLDSDDLIGSGFLAGIKATPKPHGRAWLSYCYGVVTDEKKALERRYEKNPFIALYEPATEYHWTCFVTGHTLIADPSRYPDRQVPPIIGIGQNVKAQPKRRWAQVCHGDNIVNSLSSVQIGVGKELGPWTEIREAFYP